MREFKMTMKGDTLTIQAESGKGLIYEKFYTDEIEEILDFVGTWILEGE